MKLFFTVFAAILAAAAVIWGVVSYRAAQEKDSADWHSALKLEAQQAKMAVETAITYNKVGEVALKYGPEQARDLEKYILDGKFHGSEAREFVSSYVYDYRFVIKVARGKMNDKDALEWADKMEPLLAKIEAVAKGL